MVEYLDSATVKLLIDREKECVVLGEAGQDYVDMLNSVLGFPMATVVRLARTQEGFEGYGCFTNLYRSVEGFSLECFTTAACKQMLVHPRHVEEELCRRRKVKLDNAALTKYFTCPYCCRSSGSLSVSYYGSRRCNCGKFMNKELYVELREFEVKEIKTEGPCLAFLSDSSLYMLHRPTRLLEFCKDHGIKCMSQLDEKAVTVGLKQISCLLLNSAISKTAVTDTFLKKQGADRTHQQLFSSTMKPTGKATPLTVDVLVRKSDGRIVFAVAGKEFIDLLFTFLTLPLVTVWHMIGFPYWLKGYWLALQGYKLPPYYSCHRLLPNITAQVPLSFSRTKSNWTPTFNGTFVSNYVKNCNSDDDVQDMRLIDPKSPTGVPTSSEGGYAKDETLFLVFDDLVVQHLASPSTISLLEESGISLFDLETHQISIGVKEALLLLEASFRTSSALNTAFGSLLQGSNGKPFV